MPQQNALLHLVADLAGVAPARLRDRSLVGGLLVAAAGAAGIASQSAPVVQQSKNENIAAILLLSDGHVSVHTFPERELLTLDVLSAEGFDGNRAIDVLVRRLSPSEVRSNTVMRGS
jgi:S-adenosylmethionine decarboxylase